MPIRINKRLRFLCTSLVTTVFLSACAEPPVTTRAQPALITAADELRLGREGDLELRKRYGVYADQRLQTYVNQIGERLATRSNRTQLTYQFTILDSAEVNAFALPGGYIYITRGLLAHLNTEDQLAAVLGHEIGHVTARHAVRRYSAAIAARAGLTSDSILVPELGTRMAQTVVGTIGDALLSGYGRDQELEADHLGSDYLARSGYESGAMIEVLSLLKNHELFEIDMAKTEQRPPRTYHGVFTDHPGTDDRLQEVVSAFKPPRGDTDAVPPILDRTRFVRQLDRLAYGDSASQGVRLGTGFYHSALGFTVRFTDGWNLTNTAERLVARHGNDAIIDLQVAPRGRSRSPKEYVVLQMHYPDLQDMQSFEVGGAPAFSASTRAQTPFGARRLRVAVVFRNRYAYRFLGAIDTDEPAFESHFLEVVRSLRALTPDESRVARGLRIAVVKAARGDSYAKLARNSPILGDREGVLRLLNDQYPGGEPATGSWVKTVR